MGPSEAREGCSGEERGTGEGRAEHHEVSPTHSGKRIKSPDSR